MSVAVMIISLTFMRLQDKVSVDIFGAARLRQGLLAKLRLRYKSETTIKWLVSIFTVWQFFPPIMVLSLRQSNHPTTRKEFMQVIALTWIASLYWSGVAKGFLILPVWAIKGIVLAITLYLLFELMRWGMKTSRTQKNRPQGRFSFVRGRTSAYAPRRCDLVHVMLYLSIYYK